VFTLRNVDTKKGKDRTYFFSAVTSAEADDWLTAISARTQTLTTTTSPRSAPASAQRKLWEENLANFSLERPPPALSYTQHLKGESAQLAAAHVGDAAHASKRSAAMFKKIVLAQHSCTDRTRAALVHESAKSSLNTLELKLTWRRMWEDTLKMQQKYVPAKEALDSMACIRRVKLARNILSDHTQHISIIWIMHSCTVDTDPALFIIGWRKHRAHFAKAPMLR
jgi:hypothetical protein